MKKLSFESSSSQRDELIALTKGKFLVETKLKDLHSFDSILRRHLQEAKPGTFIREDLQVAVENTKAAIQEKTTEKAWYEKPIGLIGSYIAENSVHVARTSFEQCL
ncbi:hypothetical protein GTH32_18640 [Alteromonas sp. 345S023]|uniref:Uncharacterized protein n=1 Tax=Alteromonas profundi TaxID=2696062 RepID=A0A7X5LPM2_9ALTE|nr:hypothetical protein [Alteromonas profundi]NDV93192.1 hypothetical protein [Alteromonas profundi]